MEDGVLEAPPPHGRIQGGLGRILWSNAPPQNFEIEREKEGGKEGKKSGKGEKEEKEEEIDKNVTIFQNSWHLCNLQGGAK